MQEIKNSQFALAYKEINGLSAIWFEHANREWIVDPCVLFNGMLGSDVSNTSLLYLNVDALSHRRASFYVKQEYNGDYFIWTFTQFLCETECRLWYKFNDFWNKSKDALSQLAVDITEGKSTVYDGIIKTEEIIKIFEQLKVMKVFLMPGLIRSSEIEEEELSLKCPVLEQDETEWAFDIPYVLKIGNREIASYISDWSNDMDCIRNQLESYCYGRSTKIMLYFEDEPTIINLQHVSTLTSAKTIGSGTAYNYDDYVKVEIQPNSFVKGTAIAGFCNEKKTIKEIYEGLLNVGRVGYSFEPSSYNNSWDYDAIVFYNHIKSPVIERYIGGIKGEYNTNVERQKIVHHILTIRPDYTHVLGQMTGQSAVIDVFNDDIVTLYIDNSDNELCSVHLPGVYDWLDEFNRLSDETNSNMGIMDVDSWHHRGLILAKELKKKLPDDIDVWYGYPFEDVEHRNSRPILITEGTLKE